MYRTTLFCVLFLLPILKPVETPTYTADAKLKLPADYRQWVFLTSGFDMSYQASKLPPDHSVFDNVFVNPAAYRTFTETGTWPQGTTFVLEARAAAGGVSINKRGRTQSDVTGLEVHIKDSTHNAGDGWGFYSFDDTPLAASRIPQTADCYSCHQQHAAVDTTFVQFYPTLLPIAQARKTLSKAYLADPATR